MTSISTASITTTNTKANVSKFIESASKVLMVIPSTFGFNAETATTNTFQKQSAADSKLSLEIAKKAEVETRQVVDMLRKEGVMIYAVEEKEVNIKAEPLPDAVFPNNVFTFHHNGSVGVHAMCHPSRRQERRVLESAVIKHLSIPKSVTIHRWCDEFEPKQKYGEGTGSMVMDHSAKIIYACLSPRTDSLVMEAIAKSTGYSVFTFHASTTSPIYHTNVMLSIGSTFAICCAESVTDITERQELIRKLQSSGKDVILFSISQMNDYACNVLQLLDQKGSTLLAMSDTAFAAWTTEQKQRIQDKHKCRIVHCAIPTIEKYGGGSLRCMLAEILF